MSTRGWIREAVTIVALICLIGIAGTMTLRAERAQKVLESTAPAFERSNVQDRLMGRTLDLKAFGNGSDDPGIRHVLAWFVDLDRCGGCFDTVADWLNLENDADLDLVLVLAGNIDASVEQRLRILRRTRVVRVDHTFLARKLGPALPNTKVLMDREGTVVLVDSRYSGQECGWSFEAQVARLRGLEAVRPIRDAAPLRDVRDNSDE